MAWEPIKKDLSSWAVRPNLLCYEKTCAEFSWETIRRELRGLAVGRGLNIAHEAVDRHANGALRSQLALRCISKEGKTEDFTYGDLKEKTDRFANLLGQLGIGKGDAVFALAGRIPELYITALGALKNGSVFCPLFSAFGPEPLQQRLSKGEAQVLVTTARLYRKRVAQLRTSLPLLKHVLLVDSEEDVAEDVHSFPRRLAAASSEFIIPPTDPEQQALLHFTSGTTGTPKGAIHVHEAVLMHYMTGKYVLDLHPGDVFWCTADPGWVTGTSYGILSPLTCGVTSIVDEADFDAERWYGILRDQKVSVWYTAPTAVRMMMRAGAALAKAYDLRALRFIASVGEPLNPEAVFWGEEAFGLPIHDNWWQTETGGIMIANYAAMDIRPGSMGRPFPGVEAAILARGQDGRAAVRDGKVTEVATPGVEGELALRPGWPSMFRSYLADPQRYADCFAGGWYLTGDVARRDPDGYFWFVGRADDMIKSAGHLVGPFEVESALMQHPAVDEAGVIGKPDAVAGEIVKAFVTLHPGYEPSEELRLELIGFGRTRLGAAMAPREIAFEQHLPYTTSGKVMRRLLRSRELGLPEGE